MRGTTANKANQSRGMRGGRGKASAQGHADEGAGRVPPQAPHHKGEGGGRGGDSMGGDTMGGCVGGVAALHHVCMDACVRVC